MNDRFAAADNPRMATETDFADPDGETVTLSRPFDPDKDIWGDKIRHGNGLITVRPPASRREYRKAYDEYPVFRAVVARYMEDTDTDFDETAGQTIRIESVRIGVQDVSRLEAVTWNRDRPDIETVTTPVGPDDRGDAMIAAAEDRDVTTGTPFDTYEDAVEYLADDASTPSARERVAAFFKRHATRVSDTPDEDSREDPDDVPEYDAVTDDGTAYKPLSSFGRNPTDETDQTVGEIKQAYVDGEYDEDEFESRLDRFDDPDDLVEDTPTIGFVRGGRIGFETPHMLTDRIPSVSKRGIAFFVVAPIAVVAGVVDASGAIAFMVGVGIYHAAENYL